MDIQYLSDEQGRYTAVQIPIDDWNKLTEENEVFKNYEKKKRNLLISVGQFLKIQLSNYYNTLHNPEQNGTEIYLRYEHSC